jgi:hypothetical protein
MRQFTPEKLVIFDYSGTLSLDAPRFGRQENLVPALAETGLAALGVATPEAFWDQIVNPTWAEGSTTDAGYKKVMVGRIAALGLSPGAPAGEIEAAASRFVDRYLMESRIDPHWRPVLSHLSAHTDTAVIVATDHYAEATETIIRYLRSWSIPARKGGTAPYFLQKNRELSPPFPFFVANSADLGAWKADRRFWEIVKLQLSLEHLLRLLLIDDFGFNEEEGNSYSERAKVTVRQAKTTDLLREIFQTAVEVIPFCLARDLQYQEEARARLIAEAAARIDRFLG